jgi:CDP-diacylglycerol--glycerol-3-phosphate 3-phosphatidyltransferase
VFDANHRPTVARLTDPPASQLVARGVTANALTVTGLIAAATTAVLAATGHFTLALLALVLTGLADLLDGPVAKHAKSASTRGAFLDSTIDRVADALILIGLAWYLAGSAHPHNAVLAMAVLAVTTLVSYQRAKAESLGLVANGGLMERAERMIAIAIALAVPAFLVAILWIMLILVSYTAINRFVRVYSQTSRAPKRPHPSRRQRWSTLRAQRSVYGQRRTRRRELAAPSTRKLANRRPRSLSLTRRQQR